MKPMWLALASWAVSTTFAIGPNPVWTSAGTSRQTAGRRPDAATVDVSADGRFVAFESYASLVPDDSNTVADVYALDRQSGDITLESVSAEGGSANGTSGHPRLSADGRYLVFSSVATNLVAPATELGANCVFLRDRQKRTTSLVSRGVRHGGCAWSSDPDISEDGAVIVFESGSTDLVDGPDLNGATRDVYAFDVERQVIERVSVDSSGTQHAAGSSEGASVSRDGRYIAFASSARLDARAAPAVRAAGSVAPRRDVFLRDRVLGTTTLVSRTPAGRSPNGSSYGPALSSDGRFVAFVSRATDLGVRDRNEAADVYLRDIITGNTTLVSGRTRAASADGPSHHPAISAKGEFVVFVSEASDLLCAQRCSPQRADVNLVSDVYRFNVSTRAMERISGEPGQSQWWEASAGPALDGSGGVVAFSSRHPIDSSDLRHDFDLFIHARSPP